MDWEHIGYTKAYYYEYDREWKHIYECFPIFVKVINGAIFFAVKHNDDYYTINHRDYCDGRKINEENEYFRIDDREYIVLDIPHVVGITDKAIQSNNKLSK